MTTPKQQLLQKLCSRDETYELAQKLLVVAQAKTGPGSGYELGDRSVCLPAVCAYIASQRLCNGDVKKLAAQSSVCANTKVFTQAIDIVRAALDEAEAAEDRQTPRTKLTYDTLIKRYKLGRPRTLLGWMTGVEDELTESDRQFKIGNQDITGAIFYWVCKKSKVRREGMDSLAEEYGIHQRVFDNLLKTLEKKCVNQGTQITEQVAKLRQRSNAKASSVSPSKSALSNSSPSKKRKVDEFDTDSRDDDDDDDDNMSSPPRTPTKRQKVVSSMPHNLSTGNLIHTSFDSSAIPTPSTSRSESGPSTPYHAPNQNRPLSNAMDVDSEPGDEDQDDAPRPPRRFRPVFLDHKQWYQRDPRLEREWKEAERYMESMLEHYPQVSKA